MHRSNNVCGCRGAVLQLLKDPCMPTMHRDAVCQTQILFEQNREPRTENRRTAEPQNRTLDASVILSSRQTPARCPAPSAQRLPCHLVILSRAVAHLFFESPFLAIMFHCGGYAQPTEVAYQFEAERIQPGGTHAIY